jgi:peptidoglycan hydrolase-like protein with peptidoglycan-binding domain
MTTTQTKEMKMATIPNDAGVPQTPASEADTKVEKPTLTVLHVTTPLQRGPKVLDVQQMLTLLGFFHGTCDAIYGPATEAAARAFQRSRGLTCDGIVGLVTWGSLLTAHLDGKVKPLPSGEPVVSPGTLALVEAMKHLGLKESPPSSNKTMFGVWYGHDGLKWCAIFTSYCFSVGAGRILCDGYSGPGVKQGKGCAYVPTVEVWLKSSGQWIGRTLHPEPGDLVLFDFGGNEAEHIGIVASDSGGGKFTTVEGNTSLNYQSDGGEVMMRNRMISQVRGFGRIV